MKKIFAVIAALMCFSGYAFSDEVEDLLKQPQDTLTRTITPEEQHVTNKTAKVQIEYTPLTDEVHIYYTCMAVSYDQGEAMNSVLACLQDFQKQNQYYSYKYLKRDSIKYFKDEKNLKWATYSSYVKFYR
ncbi:MAG: hypothetical protein SOT81_08580 [Treponema sp.]|nr:hypothetical protein [Treponema sp.]